MRKGHVKSDIQLLNITREPEKLLEQVAGDSYVTQRFAEDVHPELVKFKSGRVVPLKEFQLDYVLKSGDVIHGYEKDDRYVDEILPDSAERVVRFIKAIGHHKLLQMCNVTFRLKHISRKAAFHLLRYEFITTNCRSQKYQPQDQFEYLLPEDATSEQISELANCMEDIQRMYVRLRRTGLDPEWARGVLPNIASQTMTYHTNFRQLRHIIDCVGAEDYVDEVQKIVAEMWRKAKAFAPSFFDDFAEDSQGLVKRRSAKYRRNVCPNWVLSDEDRKKFNLDL